MAIRHAALVSLVAGTLLIVGAMPVAADVRLFFTSSSDGAGLVDTTHVYDDTDGNSTDGWSYALKNVAPTVGIPTVDPSKGEFLYVWARFEDEARGREINAIHFVANDQSLPGGAGETDRGEYLGLDENGDSGTRLRWHPNSKTVDDEREGEILGSLLLGPTNPGIKNSPFNGWLYRGADRVALIGAINPIEGAYEIRMGLGYNGISYRKNKDGQRGPWVKLGGNEEEFDGRVQHQYDPPRFSTDADAVVVPEPGAVVLVMVGVGMLAGRRARLR